LMLRREGSNPQLLVNSQARFQLRHIGMVPWGATEHPSPARVLPAGPHYHEPSVHC
jgi:hypothetical protein